MKTKKLMGGLLLGAGLWVGTATGATVIVNEQFADGTRATETKGAGGTYTSLNWWSNNWAAYNALTATAGSLTIHTEAPADTIAARHAVAQIAPVTMAVGDALTMSFDVKFTGISTASTSENAFRFGLYDGTVNGSVAYTGDNQNGLTNSPGYTVRLRPYDTGTGKSLFYYGRRYEQASATAPLLTSVGPCTYSNGGMSAAIANDVLYSMSMTMEFLASDEMRVRYSVFQGITELFSVEQTFSDSAMIYTSFDTLGFSVYNTTAGIGVETAELSNIKLVMTQIPEPGVYAGVLGLGALGIVFWRRRR